MELKLNRKHIIALMLFGLVLSIAVYFYFSPNDMTPGAKGTQEYKEMETAVKEYNSALENYMNAYSALATHGNSIYDDKQLTVEEIEEYIARFEPFIDACEKIIAESANVKETIQKHPQFFMDIEQTINEFDAKEDLIKNDMNRMVMSANVLRGNINNEDSPYTIKINDLSLELIEIRDR